MPPARRRPTQARSLATVERIVDSGARVLSESGYQGASTNRIAAAAGVSPGTLYQYFTDKDEIVAAVIERVVDGFGEAVAPALRAAAAMPLAEAARSVLEAVVLEFEARAALLDAFVDRVPAERYAPRVDLLRARVTDIAFQLLAARLPDADAADLARRAWITVRTTEHLAVRFVLDQPPIPRGAFLDELAAIVVHLAEPRPAASC